jgi:SpoVK/Ycf46/Vps4 family AAA+-type ATPase
MQVDAIGGARHDDGQGGDNEVQRTMLEIVNQLDGFDSRGNIKVLMATNRPDTLDPALLRPGRLDRKVEFGLPDLEGRTQIFQIHSRTMACERDIRCALLAVEYIPMLCPSIGQRWNIFPCSVRLLVSDGVYSYALSFYWLAVEYIPMLCPSIGQR